MKTLGIQYRQAQSVNLDLGMPDIAVDFGRTEMNEGSELYQSVLRAVLYALMELVSNADGTEVLAHLTLNVPNYYGDMTQRELVIELADYLAKKLETLRPEKLPPLASYVNW